MLTQLLFANKLLLDCITEQKKKKEKTKQKQTPSVVTCTWGQAGRHYLVF